jgi:hypothetical protein
MNFKKSLFLSIVYLSVVFVSQAQLGFIKKGGNQKEGTTNYPLDLSQAEDDFEIGNLAGIEAKLRPGIENKGFSKEEAIRVHRLLTLVHLFSDNEPAAEVELMELLKADPEHPINELTDPEEFKYLYRKFRTKPIFRIAVNGGLNQTRVNTIQEFGTHNTSLSTSSETSSPGIGTQFGVAIERELYGTGLEFSLGVGYSSKKFSTSNDIILGLVDLETDVRSSNNFSQMTQIDAANFLDIPLLARYNINLRGKFIPFVFGGIEANLLLSATRSEGNRTGAQTISAADQPLKISNERNNTNYSIVGGLGFKYKLKTHFFKFEVKYANGMTNVVNPENRYVNPTTVFRLAQIDNNQSLNVLSVNFGYVHSIYNPKKLKKYRN